MVHLPELRETRFLSPFSMEKDRIREIRKWLLLTEMWTDIPAEKEP
jgi:hypothetical protein